MEPKKVHKSDLSSREIQSPMAGYEHIRCQSHSYLLPRTAAHHLTRIISTAKPVDRAALDADSHTIVDGRVDIAMCPSQPLAAPSSAASPTWGASEAPTSAGGAPASAWGAPTTSTPTSSAATASATATPSAPTCWLGTLGLGQEALHRQKLGRVYEEFVTGRVRCGHDTLLHLDGEIRFVDWSKDFINLPNLSLVLKKDRSIEVGDLFVSELTYRLALTCMHEIAHSNYSVWRTFVITTTTTTATKSTPAPSATEAPATGRTTTIPTTTTAAHGSSHDSRVSFCYDVSRYQQCDADVQFREYQFDSSSW
mmetsp:Transcript_16954/g.32476  ORF Transcript_16954/g.32476 Transcript_16954/m.32476 type:complete len:310 (-) Transcript_16954:237-1166(-)